MAEELLLSGTRAVPKRLSERGFRFGHEHIEPALHALLEH
jgi:NAD dependent epimerase/dehydratase family enzyme